MSKSNAFETDLLSLIFNNTDIPLIGDAAGIQNSAVAGSLYVSLHTGDPGETGDQSTSETSYGSYARVPVARDSSGWTVNGDQVTNTGTIAFAACTSGTPTLSYFGIGTDPNGAGKLLYSGALTAPLAVSSGITPTCAPGALVVTES